MLAGALLASLDDSGELLLWQRCFLGRRPGAAPSPLEEAAHGGALVGAESSAIHQLARLPGPFQAATWLSLTAAALVAAGPSGLCVLYRAPDGRWQQEAGLAEPDEAFGAGTWLSLHAFANDAAPDAEPPRAPRSECFGFALRSDGWLGLWCASLPSEGAHAPTLTWVGQAELSGAACAAPLVRGPSHSRAAGAAAATGEGVGEVVGEVVSCGRDGSVCLWAVTIVGTSGTSPGLGLGSCTLVAHRPLQLGDSEALRPPSAGDSAPTPFVPSTVRATAGSVPRAGVLLQAAARWQLAILEFESRSPLPSVEAELELGSEEGSAPTEGASACCAWLDLGCCTYLLAVGLGDKVRLFMQRPTHDFVPQRASWCLVREIAMPAAAAG